MKYKKGDRVRHPTKDDWGLGEVLADDNGESVRIFFVEDGEKTISLNLIQPIKVSGAEAVHSGLDNLKIEKSASGIKYQSLAESIQFFLKEYPEGFYGETCNTYPTCAGLKLTISLNLTGSHINVFWNSQTI